MHAAVTHVSHLQQRNCITPEHRNAAAQAGATVM